MTKLSTIRTSALLAALMVLATGCGKDAALPWHFWLAPMFLFIALFMVFFAGPLAYYFKVWRLKHRGR